MPTFKLPLSWDVVQAISPWTAFISQIGSPWGPISVTLGQSSDPAVEADVLSDVASYGKQLGRIEDALIVLLAHFHPATPLTKEETAAIDDLKEMLQQIADVKGKRERNAMRPRLDQMPWLDPPMPQSAARPSPTQEPAPVADSGDPAATTKPRRQRRGSSRRPA